MYNIFISLYDNIALILQYFFTRIFSNLFWSLYLFQLVVEILGPLVYFWLLFRAVFIANCGIILTVLWALVI